MNTTTSCNNNSAADCIALMKTASEIDMTTHWVKGNLTADEKYNSFWRFICWLTWTSKAAELLQSFKTIDQMIQDHPELLFNKEFVSYVTCFCKKAEKIALTNLTNSINKSDAIAAQPTTANKVNNKFIEIVKSRKDEETKCRGLIDLAIGHRDLAFLKSCISQAGDDIIVDYQEKIQNWEGWEETVSNAFEEMKEKWKIYFDDVEENSPHETTKQYLDLEKGNLATKCQEYRQEFVDQAPFVEPMNRCPYSHRTVLYPKPLVILDEKLKEKDNFWIELASNEKLQPLLPFYLVPMAKTKILEADKNGKTSIHYAIENQNWTYLLTLTDPLREQDIVTWNEAALKDIFPCFVAKIGKVVNGIDSAERDMLIRVACEMIKIQPSWHKMIPEEEKKPVEDKKTTRKPTLSPVATFWKDVKAKVEKKSDDAAWEMIQAKVVLQYYQKNGAAMLTYIDERESKLTLAIDEKLKLLGNSGDIFTIPIDQMEEIL